MMQTSYQKQFASIGNVSESPMNKTKWSFRAPSVDKTALSDFAKTQNSWSNNNMYRTSYHDMSDKVSLIGYFLTYNRNLSQ